jgi:cysteine-rich repeat protein
MNKKYVKYLKYLLVILIIISISNVSAAVCGNYQVEAGEECDIGSRNGDYECTTDCKLEHRHIITTLGATSPLGGQDYVFGYYSGNLGGFDGAQQICKDFAQKEISFDGRNHRYMGNWIPILYTEIEGQQIYTLDEIEDTTYHFLFKSAGTIILHDITKDNLVKTIARRQYDHEDTQHDAQLNEKIQNNGFSYWMGIDPTDSGYQDNCYDWTRTDTYGTIFHHYQRVFNGQIVTVSEFDDNRYCYATDSSTEVVGSSAAVPARSKINFESDQGAALICVNTCGDGVLQTKFGETCDDGNVVEGDGCSSACQVESGYVCQGAIVSTCNTVCGDSIKTFDEECDDGNDDHLDGCKNDCKVDIMLMTQDAYTGNLGGLTGADQICTDEANSLKYDGTWRAVLRTEGLYTTNLISLYQDLLYSGNIPAKDLDLIYYWTALEAAQTINCGGWQYSNLEGTYYWKEKIQSDPFVYEVDYREIGCNDENPILCVRDQCGDGIVNIGEYCDDTSGLQTECEYGNPTCNVCNDCLPEILTGASCGDGITQGKYGEQCDEGINGNLDDGTGCNSNCLSENCANPADCEDNNPCTTDSCTAGNCINQPKSDGISAPDDLFCNGIEICSGGTQIPGLDPCEDNIPCTIATCNENTDICEYVYVDSICDNGEVSTKDTCTPTGCINTPIDYCENDDNYCAFGCTLADDNDCNPICGNSLIETKGAFTEACDDGLHCEDGIPCTAHTECTTGDQTCKLRAGDGCSDFCNVEFGYGCTGEPSVCQTFCGNGQVDSAFNEVCDDGNNVDGDGCSATCQIEVCGNGELNVGEQCDDGGVLSGDGCSATCTYEVISTLFSSFSAPEKIWEITTFNLDATQVNYYNADRGFVVDDIIDFTTYYEEIELGKISVKYNAALEWEVVSNTLPCSTNDACLNLIDSAVYFNVSEVGIYNLTSELLATDGVTVLESKEFEIENQLPIINEFTTKLYTSDGYLASGNAVENEGLLNIWFNATDYESPVWAYVYNSRIEPSATIQKGEIVENLYTNIFRADTGDDLFCVASENVYCSIDDAFVIDQTCEVDAMGIKIGCHCSCDAPEDLNGRSAVKDVLSNIYQGSLIESTITVDDSETIGSFPALAATSKYTFGDCTPLSPTSESCNILVYFVDEHGAFTLREYEFTINLLSQGDPIASYLVNGQNTNIVVPVDRDLIFDASSSQYRDPACDGTDNQCYVADVFDPKKLDYAWYINIRNIPWGTVDNTGNCVASSGASCSVTGSPSLRSICEGSCIPDAACTCPTIDTDGRIYDGETFETQTFTYNFEDKYVCGEYPTSLPCQVILEVTAKDTLVKSNSKKIFNINLEEQANQAPIMEIHEFDNPTSGQTLTFDITGTDPENDALTLGGTTLPDGASVTPINGDTWRFSWSVPAEVETKQISMVFTLSDGTQTVSETISFTIDSSVSAKIGGNVCGKAVPVGKEITFESTSDLGSATKAYYIWELADKGDPWGYLKSEGFSLICSNGEESCPYGEYLPNNTASSGTPCTCEIIDDYEDSWNIYPDSKIVVEDRPFIVYTYDNLNACLDSECTIKLTVVTEEAQSSDSCNVNLILEGAAGDLDGDGTVDSKDLEIFRQVLLGKSPTRVRDPSDLDVDGRLTINDYVIYARGGEGE